MSSTIISIITCIITASPIAYGLVRWKDLPEQIAIHFGMDGQPNGFASRPVAVLVIPALMVLFQIFTLFIMKKSNVAITSIPNVVIIFVIPIVSIMVAVIMYGYAFK